MILKSKIEQCELHLDRLNFAFSKIKSYYPFDAKHFPLKNYDDLAYLDMFTMRFAKLQDYMGEKLFPAVLNVLGNTHESLSYIDTLNALEKNHILESAAKWKDIRNLRNKISHEYPNCYEEQCRTLNQIMDSFHYLENTLNTIKIKLIEIDSQ
ncbi:MAG: hypothetical protein NWR43_02135 [Alphaproteobacteria bacterium]|nr:hypothetical protein [Alphaproteobacteria bacterium]